MALFACKVGGVEGAGMAESYMSFDVSGTASCLQYIDYKNSKVFANLGTSTVAQVTGLVSDYFTATHTAGSGATNTLTAKKACKIKKATYSGAGYNTPTEEEQTLAIGDTVILSTVGVQTYIAVFDI